MAKADRLPMAAFDPLRSLEIARRSIWCFGPGRWHSGTGIMKLYRINKLTGPGGTIVKKKDVLAASDRDAVQRAAESEDCPVCVVLKDGQTVGSIT